MNQHIYQHFRPEEREFIDAASDWKQQVEDQYAPYLTDFLDPRQAHILQTIVGSNEEIRLDFQGLLADGERNRALIYPAYYQAGKDDFDLQLYEIDYPEKFNQLTHGQILGTILGQGLKREKLGDIFTDRLRWQLVADSNLKLFFSSQIDRISNVKASIRPIEDEEIIQPVDSWLKEEKITSSLRIDNVLSAVLNLSREKAKTLVNARRVKLNWTEINQVNLNVEMKDIISIRGFGRIRIIDILGQTKKDKLILSVETLLKNN